MWIYGVVPHDVAQTFCLHLCKYDMKGKHFKVGICENCASLSWTFIFSLSLPVCTVKVSVLFPLLSPLLNAGETMVTDKLSIVRLR